VKLRKNTENFSKEKTILKDLIFEPSLEALLPSTYALLRSANLIVHNHVSRIVLHGSRGSKGGARLNSDIDLSLLVDSRALSDRPDKAGFLAEIAETTLSHWQGPVDVNLATVFEIRNCGLKCFYFVGLGCAIM
jgi:hypothetical protein